MTIIIWTNHSFNFYTPSQHFKSVSFSFVVLVSSSFSSLTCTGQRRICRASRSLWWAGGKTLRWFHWSYCTHQLSTSSASCRHKHEANNHINDMNVLICLLCIKQSVVHLKLPATDFFLLLFLDLNSVCQVADHAFVEQQTSVCLWNSKAGETLSWLQI